MINIVTQHWYALWRAHLAHYVLLAAVPHKGLRDVMHRSPWGIFPSAGLKLHGCLYRDFCVLFLCFVINVVWILKMDIWKCVPVQKEIYFKVSKAYNSVSSTRLRIYVYPSVEDFTNNFCLRRVAATIDNTRELRRANETHRNFPRHVADLRRVWERISQSSYDAFTSQNRSQTLHRATYTEGVDVRRVELTLF